MNIFVLDWILFVYSSQTLNRCENIDVPIQSTKADDDKKSLWTQNRAHKQRRGSLKVSNITLRLIFYIRCQSQCCWCRASQGRPSGRPPRFVRFRRGAEHGRSFLSPAGPLHFVRLRRGAGHSRSFLLPPDRFKRRGDCWRSITPSSPACLYNSLPSAENFSNSCEHSLFVLSNQLISPGGRRGRPGHPARVQIKVINIRLGTHAAKQWNFCWGKKTFNSTKYTL